MSHAFFFFLRIISLDFGVSLCCCSGLDILKDMLDRVEHLPRDQSQPFYKRFYMQILQHVLAVVADSSQVHVAGEFVHLP